MKIPNTVRQHWVYKTFWTKEKRGGQVGSRVLVSEVRLGHFQVVEKSGMHLLAESLPGNSETLRGMEYGVHRPLPEALQFSIPNSN